MSSVRLGAGRVSDGELTEFQRMYRYLKPLYIEARRKQGLNHVGFGVYMARELGITTASVTRLNQSDQYEFHVSPVRFQRLANLLGVGVPQLIRVMEGEVNK